MRRDLCLIFGNSVPNLQDKFSIRVFLSTLPLQKGENCWKRCHLNRSGCGSDNGRWQSGCHLLEFCVSQDCNNLLVFLPLHYGHVLTLVSHASRSYTTYLEWQTVPDRGYPANLRMKLVDNKCQGKS